MNIFSISQSIFIHIKIKLISGLHLIHKNDLSKLFVAFVFIISMGQKDAIPSVLNLEMVVRMVIGVLCLIAILYCLCWMYYSTFSIKKTVYHFSKIIYFFSFIIFILYIFLKFNDEVNRSFFVFYDVIYATALLLMAFELRKIFIQQYLNVKNSVFKVITEKTGLIVIASTPYIIFGKTTTTSINNYMIGFNNNIRTWFLLGIFFKMDKDTVCLNNVWIPYDTILTFNNHFNKKITNYNKDEIKTVIMYSF